MSDFLQFVDRIPTLPNRKKLTFESDGSIKYAKVEYADEPIEEGTFLNKAKFNIINSVLGYNEIIGTYDSANETVEYTIDIDISNFINNQRLLVKCANDLKVPATNFDIEKTDTIATIFSTPQLIEMSNGNIMASGTYSEKGYIVLFDKNGNVIKSATQLGSYMSNTQLIEMSNGNIMVIGYRDNSTAPGYFAIVNKDGAVSKTATALGLTGFNNAQLIEMSNGNIMLAYGNTNGYAKIIDNQGAEITQTISLGNDFGNIQLIEMSNRNIMIVGNFGYITILDQQGNIVKSKTSIGGATTTPQLIEMSNGNIMIVGTNNNGYIVILDQQGNIIKSRTNIGAGFDYPQLIEMSNGNIMIVGNQTMTIVDNQGNIIKERTYIEFYSRPHLIEMSNGGIMIASYSGVTGYITILDQQGNIVKQPSSIGSSFADIQLLETSSKKIMLVGENHYMTLQPKASVSNCYINNINLDTIIYEGECFELLYNATQNKFIAEEVRNAN